MATTLNASGPAGESPRIDAINAFIDIEGGNRWNTLHGLQSIAVEQRKRELRALPEKLSTKDALLAGETVRVKDEHVRWEDMPAFRERVRDAIREARAIFEQSQVGLPEGYSYALTSAIGTCDTLANNLDLAYIDPDEALRSMRADLLGRNRQFVKHLQEYDDTYGNGIDPKKISAFERDAERAIGLLRELNRFHEARTAFGAIAIRKQKPECTTVICPAMDTIAKTASGIDGTERNPANTRENAECVFQLAQLSRQLRDRGEFVDRNELRRWLEKIVESAEDWKTATQRRYGQREEFVAALRAVREIVNGVPDEVPVDAAKKTVEAVQQQSRGFFRRWFGGA